MSEALSLFRPDRLAAAVVFVVSAATIAAAWGFELIGGYVPCALCLQERIPYYVGVPIALVAVFVAFAGGPKWLARLLLLVVAVVFACNYHSVNLVTKFAWRLGSHFRSPLLSLEHITDRPNY